LQLIPLPPPGDHVVWRNQAGTRLDAEALPLGRLAAISGAAFTTGLGARTSLGISLMLGLLNVRLGHWWRSGTDHGLRGGRRGARGAVPDALSRWLPVYAHLLQELLARFPGTARRHWYLSDGGHFDNTGCYELIRRRVPFIVVLDDGADPEYRFEDLSQLIRKARLDLGAEIRFARPSEHARLQSSCARFVGGLGELRGARGKPADVPPAWNAAYATVLVAEYHDETPPSRILWVKPGLLGDEPQDVLHYAGSHADFPQETTSDQFFDEAQWESYRRLGEVIGERLFFPAGGAEDWLRETFA
jgi:hypothetical protein